MVGDEALTLHLVSVMVVDRPGALAAIARYLADHRVDLRGFVADPAGLTFLIKDIGKARQALEGAHFQFEICEVEEVLLDDRPGELAHLCEALATEGINIVTAFGVAHGGAGRIYLRVDDLKRAAPILDSLGRGPVVVHSGLGRI